MKPFLHITLIIFVFLRLFSTAEGSPVVPFKKGKNYNEGLDSFRNSELVYHDLVYLTESVKLAATSYPSISILNISLRKNPDLVEAWRALKEVNVDDAVRKGTNGELEFVRKYKDDFPDRNVVQEITDAGGYQKWVDNLAKEPDDLIATLTGSIKSTYDDLIKAGLKSEVKASSILLKNTSEETVAIIFNGKLIPAKWAWQKNFSDANKIVTSDGYILIKDGNEFKFDLGFKEGRKLEAKEVNDYLVNGQSKDLDGQPYWAGTQVDEVLLGKNGETIYFVENYSDGTPNPGQYGSKDPIATIKELREKLAVKEAWKTTANEPTLRAYRVKKALKVRSGTIGRQSDNGIELPGGGHQYEIIDYLGKNWEDYLEPLGSRVGTKLK